MSKELTKDEQRDFNVGIFIGIVSFPEIIKIIKSKKQTDKLRAKGIKIHGKSQ